MCLTCLFKTVWLLFWLKIWTDKTDGGTTNSWRAFLKVIVENMICEHLLIQLSINISLLVMRYEFVSMICKQVNNIRDTVFKMNWKLKNYLKLYKKSRFWLLFLSIITILYIWALWGVCDSILNQFLDFIQR